jgi:hypothetical protein
VGVTADNGSRKRRRRAFSLNGLAIQLSAFALSFTLVALLVVTGSKAAFVEENEIVTNHVPLGPPEQDGGGDGGPWRPFPRSPGSPLPSTAPVVDGVAGPVVDGLEEPEPPRPVVELSDTDGGTAMFPGGTVLAPGSRYDRCLAVTYTGDVDPSPVRLYAAQASGGLAPYLDLVVEMGPATDEPFGTCAGFVPSVTVYHGTLADLGAEHSTYARGLPTWDPAESGETRSFRFSLGVRDAPEAEGRATAFGFTWETRG